MCVRHPRLRADRANKVVRSFVVQVREAIMLTSYAHSYSGPLVDDLEPGPESRRENPVGRLARLVVDDRASLLRFARRRTGSLEAAEEMLQLALVRAVDRIASLGDVRKIRPWFYRTLRSVIAEHPGAGEIRDGSAVARLFAYADGGLDVEATTARCAFTLGLIDRLPSDVAWVVRRVDLDGEPVPLVVAELGVTTGEVMARLHRGRHALRDELLRWCAVHAPRARPARRLDA
jgi:DNA-directed RNA polymerase specialized sigma24 family protein